MCQFQLFILFILSTLLIIVFGLFEVDMTGGRSIVPNETKFINFDKLRVRKVSHTEYLAVGEIDVLAELDNNFKVCFIL